MAAGMPNQTFVDRFVLMPEDVASRRDSRPVDLRMLLKQIARQSPRGFGDNLKRTNHGIDSSAVSTKASKSNPATKAPIASILSTMSNSRCAGFLEGIDRVAQNIST
jgi:hypothetical protein